jgi:hypothetical protein
MAEESKEIIEKIFGGGGERRFEDIFLLMMAQQGGAGGLDANSLLTAFAVSKLAKGRGSEGLMMAFVLLNSASQATAQSVGTGAAPANNLLPLLIAMGLFGEEEERVVKTITNFPATKPR